MSNNAEGWIRHRGGKCPVKVGVKVDYRMRNGRLGINERSELLDWARSDESPKSDIMAYRLHKPAEQVAPFIEAVQAFNALSKVPQLDCPTGWRDRITEIDATTKALKTERADLVQKLASEGFALIGRINDLLTDAAQKHEDMSDWRNWKKGDLIECTGKSGGYSPGSIYTVKSINHDRGVVHTVTDDSGSITNGWGGNMFIWKSRRSA